jgi:hypothetical protein
VAWLITAVLCVLVAGSPLAACPFMQSKSAQTDMPCCPRKPVPAKHCPVSSDLQVCPLYTTEGKIGIAKEKFEIAKFSISLAQIFHPIWLPSPETAGEVDHFAATGLYLVNRVLRI